MSPLTLFFFMFHLSRYAETAGWIWCLPSVFTSLLWDFLFQEFPSKAADSDECWGCFRWKASWRFKLDHGSSILIGKKIVVTSLYRCLNLSCAYPFIFLFPICWVYPDARAIFYDPQPFNHRLFMSTSEENRINTALSDQWTFSDQWTLPPQDQRHQHPQPHQPHQPHQTRGIHTKPWQAMPPTCYFRSNSLKDEHNSICCCIRPYLPSSSNGSNLNAAMPGI